MHHVTFFLWRFFWFRVFVFWIAARVPEGVQGWLVNETPMMCHLCKTSAARGDWRVVDASARVAGCARMCDGVWRGRGA